ncbi:sulfurtransferase [Gammaproteobacteria bacterium 45_16_T64]|nr:sulfurtransferase [Gammaproteobacteria bacterium 45_16_T64]
MDRVIEFAFNHVALVGGFFGLLAAFLFLESRRGGLSVSSQQLTNLVNSEGAIVLDVRDRKEYGDGHITESKNIPFVKLEERIAELNSHKDAPIVVVCKMGQHSGAAGKILTKNGFANVRRLTGGIGTWRADGLPLVKG